MFWVRVVSLVSLIECVPRYPGGRSPSSSYVYSSFLQGEPYIVRIEHAFVTQPLTRMYPETFRSNPGIIQVKPCETPRDGAMLSQTALLSPDLPTTTTTTTIINFLLRSCFEFEFLRLCLFRSILTGEIHCWPKSYVTAAF